MTAKRAESFDQTVLPLSFFLRPAEDVARDLLGRLVVCRIEGVETAIRIVETEAYLGIEDPASHAWGNRRTKRTRTLFREGGCAYVYLIYGLHNCLNAVTGGEGEAGAVLMRAGEPTRGASEMIRRRGLSEPVRAGAIAGGPGRFCQAMGIDRSLDGVALNSGVLSIRAGGPVGPDRVVRGSRIGIDYAGDAVAWPLRFGIADNDHLSRRMPQQDRDG